MRRIVSLVICSLLLFTGVSLCQEQKHEHASAPASKAKGPKLDKAYLQQVLDAFNSLDPKNAAKYYGKGNDHVFYDVAPVKYNGWAEYEKGVTEFFKTLKSLKMTLNDDTQIHHEGGIAWSTSTIKFDMVDKDGKSSSMPMRWTAIWHNHGGNWVIAHEHVSVPMPEEPAKP